jgi:leucyl aminopeptidase (aminopeptidase T)
MADSSLSRLATKILTESLNLKKGESVTVETWNTGADLAKEVVKHARRMGCIPIMVYEDEETFVDGVKNTPKDVLGQMGKHESAMLSATDAYVFIPGPPLGAYFKRITRREYADSTRYNDSWYEAAAKARLRGVRLSYGYVGRDLAGFLGKKPQSIVQAQQRGIFVDLNELGRKGRPILDKFRDGARAEISSGAGTLNFELKGEATLEDGKVDEQDVSSGQNIAYLPPGMVAKDVDPSSASGKVKLSPSLTRLGVVGPVTLSFENGKLVKWSASGNSKAVLAKLFELVKEEDRKLTYLTVGLNEKLRYGFAVDRFVAGSIAISGFGFVGVLRDGTLKVDGAKVVDSGVL